MVLETRIFAGWLTSGPVGHEKAGGEKTDGGEGEGKNRSSAPSGPLPKRRIQILTELR